MGCTCIPCTPWLCLCAHSGFDLGFDTLQSHTSQLKHGNLQWMYVTASPNVQQYGKDKNVIEDDPFQVECVAWGTGKLNVTWIFKGAPVVADENRITLKQSSSSGRLMENAVLRIQSMEYDDAGDYMCVVINEYGNATAVIKVHVKGMILSLFGCLSALCYDLLKLHLYKQ